MKMPKVVSKAIILTISLLMMMSFLAEVSSAGTKLHVKNKNARIAAKTVIKKAGIKKSDKRRTKFKKCYKVIKKYKYGKKKKKAPKNKKQVFKLARKVTKKKKAKCYGYASTVATVAKALGYKNVKVRVGKINRPGQGVQVHTWVTIGKKVVDASFDNSYTHWTGSNKLKFFMRSYKKIKTKNPAKFRIKYTKVNRTIKI